MKPSVIRFDFGQAQAVYLFCVSNIKYEGVQLVFYLKYVLNEDSMKKFYIMKSTYTNQFFNLIIAYKNWVYNKK